MKIRVGIVGYGNLGRGVEYAVKNTEDMELCAVFTRRNPETVKTVFNAPVYNINTALNFKDKLDVLIMCGGSANDLPIQTPEFAEHFNVVDSFDTHAKIPSHFNNVDTAAKKAGKIGIISIGWDPGLFSLMRALGKAVLPNGNDYTFWGKGVSQGHSDAIRRIDGVLDARQYTIPIESALQSVRNCENPTLTAREKHLRECFVVAKEGADLNKIENEIKTMPNYFDEYNTTVHFISMEELNKNHKGIPHGGFVFRTGSSGKDNENKHVMEFKLKLDSNPEFTSGVLVAFARAAYKLNKKGVSGCKTIFDIAPKYLLSESEEFVRKTML